MQTEFTLNHDSVILFNGDPVVIIKAQGLCVPIRIGLPEAHAIQCELAGHETLRPSTHDLVKNLLIELDAPVVRIAITEFRKGIYSASLFIEKDGAERFLDCRPSDAIALALRFGAPMFIEEDVLLKSLDDDDVKVLLEYVEKMIPSAMHEPGT